jgi:hypothetical protein
MTFGGDRAHVAERDVDGLMRVLVPAIWHYDASSAVFELFEFASSALKAPYWPGCAIGHGLGPGLPSAAELQLMLSTGPQTRQGTNRPLPGA